MLDTLVPASAITSYLENYWSNDLHKAVLVVFGIGVVYFVLLRRFIVVILILGAFAGALYVCAKRGWDPSAFAIIQGLLVVIEVVVGWFWEVFF